MTGSPNEKPTPFDLNPGDLAARKRADLKRLFPEVFDEDKIDFDQLRRVMGDWVDERNERFGLTWPGKAACMKVIQAPANGALRPDYNESVNFADSNNVFIEGDNLEILKLLQKSYFGKFKLIYIDPPYNTGKEFIYPDKFAENLETYLSYTEQVDVDGLRFSTNVDKAGRFHSRWLNMIYPRLYLAKHLLREDGVIAVSIDDNEFLNLGHLMDQIFGEEMRLGFIANVNNPKGRSDDKYIAGAHEYILLYRIGETSLTGWEPEEHITRRYNKSDKNGRKYREIDLRKTGDADKRSHRPKMFYPFYWDKKSNILKMENDFPENAVIEEITPIRDDGSDGRWRWGSDTAAENIEKLHARFMPQGDRWSVFEKDYLDERSGVKPTTSWTFKDVNSERGSEQFIELGFDKEIFPNPKPVGTLTRLLHLACPDTENFTVFDFFAGSATLADAVITFNAGRLNPVNFVVTQLPDKTDIDDAATEAGFMNIAQIGRERIRRKLRAAGSDEGFRAFSLSPSAFSMWDAGSNEEIADLLTKLDSHSASLRYGDDQDIIFELLLKDGFDLTTKVDLTPITGCDVYSVAGGALLICLERNLTKEIIDALAAHAEKMDAARIVCLDAGFQGNDQLKTNAVQTFKSRLGHGEDGSMFRTV